MREYEASAEVLSGPWFDQPEQAYRQRLGAISNQPDLAKAAAQFRKDGYLIRDFGFSETDLDEAAAYSKSMKAGRVQNGWLVNPAVRRLAADRRVTAFL